MFNNFSKASEFLVDSGCKITLEVIDYNSHYLNIEIDDESLLFLKIKNNKIYNYLRSYEIL